MNLNQNNGGLCSVGTLKTRPTQDWPNRRIAIVSSHINDPALDIPETFIWKTTNNSFIIYTEENRAAVRVCESNHLASKFFSVWRLHCAMSKNYLLEFRSRILACRYLPFNFFERVQHGLVPVPFTAAAECLGAAFHYYGDELLDAWLVNAPGTQNLAHPILSP